MPFLFSSLSPFPPSLGYPQMIYLFHFYPLTTYYFGARPVKNDLFPVDFFALMGGISSSSLAVSNITDSRTKVYQLIVTEFAPCKVKDLILAPHNSFWCRVCKHIPAKFQEVKPCSQDKLPSICLCSSDASFDMSCAAVWQHLR
jgi:hypothetical protein